MSGRTLSHRAAVALALFVTFLWATSWVVIKIGLGSIPPLIFAGLRYSLAWLCLLPFFIRTRSDLALRSANRRTWLLLILQGLIYYTLTQGSQFLSLTYLPAIMLNIVLSFTTVLVAAAGIFLLHEKLTLLQWGAVFVSLAGALIYFFPLPIDEFPLVGLIFALIGLFSNSGATLLGRYLNSDRKLPALAVTFIPMSAGGLILVLAGLCLQDMPQLSLLDWGLVAWLAVVNTALAFTLWNLTLRRLPAVESAMINNTMIIQVPLLAVLFLGETMDVKQVLGLLLVACGTVTVQLGRKKES